MITEDYVSLDTAKLLKKRGFEEPIGLAYWDDGTEIELHNPIEQIKQQAHHIVFRPTLQMAMKWLRKEKDVQIEISIVGTDTWESPTKWLYGFRCQTKDIIDRRNADFSSYEEACEAAIKYCLENLI